MSRDTPEPDCYVKLPDGEGGVRWVACMDLGIRARERPGGERHVEVLVRPIGALTMAWIHSNQTADAASFDDGEVDVDIV